MPAVSSKLLRALFEKLRGAQQANKGGAARDVFAPDQTANPGAVLEVPSAAVTGARKNFRGAQPVDPLAQKLPGSNNPDVLNQNDIDQAMLEAARVGRADDTALIDAISEQIAGRRITGR